MGSHVIEDPPRREGTAEGGCTARGTHLNPANRRLQGHGLLRSLVFIVLLPPNSTQYSSPHGTLISLHAPSYTKIVVDALKLAVLPL